MCAEDPTEGVGERRKSKEVETADEGRMGEGAWMGDGEEKV